ncbi:hypothetical protein DFH06DRAFT_1349264 [Mycena polygramma]|nr:hypothetical protein DFH06DRAFT_1349264 [Mycena polygramma]
MVKALVYVGEDWCFCGHLKESCNDCCIDHRGSNNLKLPPWLKKSGWPQSEIDSLLDLELDIMRRPAFQVSSIASKNHVPNSEDATYKCKTHSEVACPTCFDFGALLLQDAGFWGKHLACAFAFN